MSDYISRQAAISAICNACGKIDCDKMDKCEKLQLPPANCSEFPNNSDTISRQAAIDALDRIFDSIPMEQTTEILLLRKDLRNLPSAQPEPLTDKEQRIFLAAMGREEKVCKQVDEECRDCREPYEDSLVWVCHEIMRKVKKALWET